MSPQMKYYYKNKEKFVEWTRTYYKRHKGTKRYKRLQSKYGHTYNRRIKLQVISKYGGKCKCCKETTVDFLTIDHINRDRHKERIVNYYRDLAKMPKRK